VRYKKLSQKIRQKNNSITGINQGGPHHHGQTQSITANFDGGYSSPHTSPPKNKNSHLPETAAEMLASGQAGSTGKKTANTFSQRARSLQHPGGGPSSGMNQTAFQTSGAFTSNTLNSSTVNSYKLG
jgi:hypothetical protein